jgi:D-alanine-D-alanine ligase
MKLRVAVLYGGRSGEHEVSVRSAESVMAVMDRSRYEIVPVFITPEGRWEPGPILPEPGGNPGIDVVFPVLHGTFGEDGTVQGLLELADLPYVGAGVLASSVSMDKEVMKRLCRESGLPVVDYAVLSRAEIANFECPFPMPVYVKPANMGSSVGISRVARAEDLPAALAAAAQYDRKIIVEREVRGRELECSVLGNDEPQASLPCEILPSRDFYDYEDKYLLDKAQTVVPAALDDALTAEIRRLAIACYKAVECAGMARVDFLLDCSADKLYLNEINTIPGFTSISMYPKMWEATGIPYSELIDKLIALALARHNEKKTIRYKR